MAIREPVAEAKYLILLAMPWPPVAGIRIAKLICKSFFTTVSFGIFKRRKE